MVMSFVLSFFPRGVLDEILNFIESVSEGFPSYSYRLFEKRLLQDVKFSGQYFLTAQIIKHTVNMHLPFGGKKKYL